MKIILTDEIFNILYHLLNKFLPYFIRFRIFIFSFIGSSIKTRKMVKLLSKNLHFENRAIMFVFESGNDSNLGHSEFQSSPTIF